MQQISQTLQALATQYQVGVADIIAFAGAHATVSCPLGPTVKTLIGRKDSYNAAPDQSLLPSNASLSAPATLSLMADKGFNGPDTAALIGAHTTSKQKFVDPSKAGEPQDSTPGIWDVAYYGQTSNPPRDVFVFNSDKSLSEDPSSGPAFKAFVGQQV
jgi:L-ascorbate peroxidase